MFRPAQAETGLVRRSRSHRDVAKGRAGEALRVGPYFEYAASLLTTRSLRRGGRLLGSPRSGAPRGAQPGPQQARPTHRTNGAKVSQEPARHEQRKRGGPIGMKPTVGTSVPPVPS